MAEEFHTHEFGNGLTLVAQRMGSVSSTAMTIAIPAGAARDPADQAGAAAVACEWLFRGAGDRDTRQLNSALDSLGCQHHEHANSAHVLLGAAQLGRNLPEIVSIYGDVLRRPRLAEETFEPCRQLVQQALDGLEDEPAHKCNILIRQQFYPYPLGRNPYGTKETLARLQPVSLRQHLQRHFTPRGTILAVAGAFEWAQLLDLFERHLGDWQGPGPPAAAAAPASGGVAHLDKQTAQVQITLAYPAAKVSHRQFYAARMAQMVLSSGMSSRLFTEVREKRGLVYAVMAQYHSLKDHAGIFVYAGTTPERAQQTLEVTVAVLRGLRQGVHDDELERARTQLKSALVMQGESTSARADALAGDYYHLRRLRSLSEIAAAVEAVKAGDVREYVEAFPPAPLTMLTIGPKALDESVLS